ncbi:metallophosphoesterase [Terriglobus sp.]|uniref:metallophosphoesterase n=1 Tax=Terriglobus sp. TaxID=1889013 RepID=UPI003AFF993F
MSQTVRIAVRVLVRVSMLLLACNGRPALEAQSTAKSLPETTVTAVLMSDPHLDPFRDPAKAKRLAAAPPEQWAAILAEAPSADADTQFDALQKTCTVKLADADAALELSAFNDARAAQPSIVLIGGDMLVHGFSCRYRALLDPSGTDTAGLADFAVKTVEFQLSQLQQRFPKAQIHLALGNNDTDCEDYALDENSRFLNRLVDAVAAGWTGVSPAERTRAKQDFKRFGSYNLPLAAAVPNTRILVLDDLYLSSDYRGTCNKKSNGASATALLTWVGAQLAQAKRAHQAVWLLAHIPPELNVYRTYMHPHDICHGEAPATFFPSDDFNNLIMQYTDTVRIFVAGHTHIDEIHLLEGASAQSGSVPLKVIPSLSPVSTNAPAYLLAQIDPGSAELLNYQKRVAAAQAGATPQWSTAYDFRALYQEPAFTAASVNDLLHRWQTTPDTSAVQIDAYERSVASGLRQLAFRASWPQQLCAMQHSSAAAFAACACFARGGLLPPAQSAK